MQYSWAAHPQPWARDVDSDAFGLNRIIDDVGTQKGMPLALAPAA
jgi:hypothetical protein